MFDRQLKSLIAAILWSSDHIVAELMKKRIGYHSSYSPWTFAQAKEAAKEFLE